MRTIKFRGKANHPESLRYGTFVYGSLITRGDIDPLINTDDNHCPIDVLVDPNTIGQFSGLYDKNGKEIYEGDIFKINELDGVISWHPNGYWCLHTSKEDVSEKSYISLGEVIEYAIREKYDYEVIGNIYDTKTEEEK